MGVGVEMTPHMVLQQRGCGCVQTTHGVGVGIETSDSPPRRVCRVQMSTTHTRGISSTRPDPCQSLSLTPELPGWRKPINSCE